MNTPVEQMSGLELLEAISERAKSGTPKEVEYIATELERIVAEHNLETKCPNCSSLSTELEAKTTELQNLTESGPFAKLVKELVQAHNAELETLKSRFNAATKFKVLSADESSTIEIFRVYAGENQSWSVYISHYGCYGPINGRHGCFGSANEAWDSLVVDGWIK